MQSSLLFDSEDSDMGAIASNNTWVDQLQSHVGVSVSVALNIPSATDISSLFSSS